MCLEKSVFFTKSLKQYKCHEERIMECFILVAMVTQGHVMPRGVKAALTLVLLPANSAVNPLLYAMTCYMRRRQREQEARLMARLVAIRRAQKK